MQELVPDFLADFAEFSTFGERNGGLHRLTLTDEDRRARDRLAALAAARGWFARTDQVGNQFFFVAEPDERPVVMVGSHLDSQPDGGRFDGQVGVVTAFHAVAALEDRVRSGDYRYNLAVVNWTNEEGARFQPSVLGSSVHIGAVPLETAWGLRDTAGVVLKDELERIGYLGGDEVALPAAYVEVHVEQGPVLEDEGIDIGVVEGAWAALKLDLTIHGEQTHTGPTPMARRVDAMYAMAKVITAVHELGLADPDGRLHTTVGSLGTEPGSPNCTPSRVWAKVELRSDDIEKVRAARSALDEVLTDLAATTGARPEVTSESLRDVGRMWAPGTTLVEQVSAAAGLSSKRVKTIAGHDAVVMNNAVPTVLFFIPAHGGFTHNRHEFTSDSDLGNGLRAMVGVLDALPGLEELP
ncbi:allantoate amidohydrolase [Aestuariimicrobium sp. Y1814]|uniref:allantoate amidohydrolase n=1 Tax=Aestuariimicrobium sp. Y1814 TaxID=3418742 RepID=UPI003DA79122